MIERLVAWLWTLLAYLSPQVSELGDEYDNFPIPEHPSEVPDAYGYPEEDNDASDPANKGELPTNGPYPGGPG